MHVSSEQQHYLLARLADFSFVLESWEVRLISPLFQPHGEIIQFSDEKGGEFFSQRNVRGSDLCQATSYRCIKVTASLNNQIKWLEKGNQGGCHIPVSGSQGNICFACCFGSRWNSLQSGIKFLLSFNTLLVETACKNCNYFVKMFFHKLMWKEENSNRHMRNLQKL